MFKKRSLNDKQILIFVRLINTSKKFLVFLALFGQLVSILPQQIVHASDVIKDENPAVVEEDTAYESHEVDIATVPLLVKMYQEEQSMKNTLENLMAHMKLQSMTMKFTI